MKAKITEKAEKLKKETESKKQLEEVSNSWRFFLDFLELDYKDWHLTPLATEFFTKFRCLFWVFL